MPSIIKREPEQLSLFGDAITHGTPGPETALNTNRVIIPVLINDNTRPNKKTVKQTLGIPETEESFARFISDISTFASAKDIKGLFDLAHIRRFSINRDHITYRSMHNQLSSWVCLGDEIELVPTPWNERENIKTLKAHETFHRTQLGDYERTVTIALNFCYISNQNAEAYTLPVEVVLTNNSVSQMCHCEPEHSRTVVQSISVKKPALINKKLNNVLTIQSETDIADIIRVNKPWLSEWCFRNTFPLKTVALYPWLEILHKAGYGALVNRFLRPAGYYVSDKDIENFNRVCQRGTQPKDIFKCDKAVYTALKNEPNLDKWDAYRKLNKKGIVTKDSIALISAMNMDSKSLELFNNILSTKHNGRQVFSLQSLVNYLNRLDMYEAIATREALIILRDYLHMCNNLEMRPRLDGDSLKREHDIAARLCREKRNEIYATQMRESEERRQREIEEGRSKLVRGDYHEQIYFVRRITDYNDLLDEAIQQNNCVASYANRISENQCHIFVLRETAHPEKSLVTIELSPDCRTIRQKYLANNQVIRNKSINDFIERWYNQLNAA